MTKDRSRAAQWLSLSRIRLRNVHSLFHFGRYWPHRAAGLPPGQRLLETMPRFSDNPLKAPPPIPDYPSLRISVDGDEMTVVAVSVLVSSPDARNLVADFHCVTTWSVRALNWRGVSLAELVSRCVSGHHLPDFAVAEGLDGMRAVFRTEDLLHDRTLLATHLQGEPLTLRHGGPLRLVTPHLYGYKNIKHLATIDFSSSLPVSTTGPKEHLRARVELEERHSRLPSALVRWPYRLAVPLTSALAERALRKARP